MLRLAESHDTVSVVTDQVGQPTWSLDLAHMIRTLVESGIASGVFHGTNTGQASWFDFAQTIFATAGLDPRRVQATTSDEFPRPAARPAWSVLGHDSWDAAGLPRPRPWNEAWDEAYPVVFPGRMPGSPS